MNVTRNSFLIAAAAVLLFNSSAAALTVQPFPPGTILVLCTAEDGSASVPALMSLNPTTGARTIISDFLNGAGPNFQELGDIAIAPNGSVFIADGGKGIISVDLQTGNRTILSGLGVGTGPDLIRPSGLAIDAAGNLLVTDLGHILNATDGILFSVDPNNGNRTTLSNSSVGTGAQLGNPQDVELNADGKPIVVEFGNTANPYGLISIDQASGNRTLISSNALGTGPAISEPGGIVIDSNGKHFVTGGVSSGAAVVFTVDPATGDRIVVSGNSVGSGTTLQQLAKITTDLSDNLLVADFGGDRIFRIDPLSGNRTVLYQRFSGSGPQLRQPKAMVVVPIPEPTCTLLACLALAAWALCTRCRLLV
jgi:hypothetical protein